MDIEMQFKQVWISFHRLNMPLNIPKHETAKISGVFISGFLQGKQKPLHHRSPEITKCEMSEPRLNLSR
jgi:hypothetical protein